MNCFEMEGTTLVRYKGLGGRVVVPEKVERIEQDAFFDRYATITSIVFPSRLKEIPERLLEKPFSGKSRLKKVVIRSGLKIDTAAFAECGELKKIEIPEGVQEIGQEAFDGCSNLRAVQLPSTLRAVGHRAFDPSNQQLHVAYPNGLQEAPHKVERWHPPEFSDYESYAASYHHETRGDGW